jgi:hypothetical protein
MKTIQGMIAQYFIMRNNTIEIEFVSASNKLKTEKKDVKATYTERKKLGIKKTQEFLESDFKNPKWSDHFNNHLKKDDLADSFLQGTWFITNRMV